MKRRVLACVLLSGCRYGGADEDPLAGYEPASPVEVVTLDASRVEDGDVERRDTGATTSWQPLDAGDVEPNACAPATPAAVCDPVRNTGCPPIPLMQCDADIMAATPTGRCAIFTPTPILPCSSTTTETSTACLPQTACFNGECRKLCYCDRDCDPGQTCDLAAGAFKLCR